MESAPVVDREVRAQESVAVQAAVPGPVAVVDTVPFWYDKLVAILFLVGIGVFGVISLADLLSNFFR
jgi:hypothetical protein